MSQIGLLKAWWTTLAEIFSSPSTFFRQFWESSSGFMALLFALAMSSLQSLLDAFWSIIGIVFNISFLSREESLSILLFGVCKTILVVGCVTFLFHIGAASTRLRKLNPRLTFKVACYAKASAVASIIPMLGPIIAFVWFLLLLIKGLSTVHQNKISSTLFAMVRGTIMLITLAGLIVAVFGGIAAGILFKDLSLLFR